MRRNGRSGRLNVDSAYWQLIAIIHDDRLLASKVQNKRGISMIMGMDVELG